MKVKFGTFLIFIGSPWVIIAASFLFTGIYSYNKFVNTGIKTTAIVVSVETWETKPRAGIWNSSWTVRHGADLVTFTTKNNEEITTRLDSNSSSYLHSLIHEGQELTIYYLPSEPSQVMNADPLPYRRSVFVLLVAIGFGLVIIISGILHNVFLAKKLIKEERIKNAPIYTRPL